MAENDDIKETGAEIPAEIPAETPAPEVKVRKKAKPRAKKIKGGKLILVESPTKVKTIKKYLSGKYKVMATKGHIKDLPKSKLGIDIENNFLPHYIVMKDKRLILSEIKKEIKTVDEVYLATDPDREGEALGWHVAEEVKKLGDKKIFRVMFNEITKTAVLKAIENPRETFAGNRGGQNKPAVRQLAPDKAILANSPNEWELLNVQRPAP